jgi:hypothetical protein
MHKQTDLAITRGLNKNHFHSPSAATDDEKLGPPPAEDEKPRPLASGGEGGTVK